jgi:hypothetical protein
MNRATADNQSAQAEEEGLEPTKEWVKELIDEIIAEEFSSPDLELHWLDEDADPRATEAALEGRVKLGALTLNEMRGALGLDPFDNAAADRPMVLTPAGYVPIEAGASPPSSSAGGAPRGANAAGIPLTRGSMRPRGPTDFPVERGNDVSLEKYSPDQPRVPAGNPDGGQWTSDDGSGGSNDSRVISDAASDNTWIPGAEYAGGIEDDDNESRSSGQPFEGTPAQQARDALALAQYRSMLAQLRRLDPTWTPSASAVDPNSIEGDIAQLRAATQEAEAHLTYLKSLGFLRDPETGHVVPRPERQKLAIRALMQRLIY